MGSWGGAERAGRGEAEWGGKGNGLATHLNPPPFSPLYHQSMTKDSE